MPDGGGVSGDGWPTGPAPSAAYHNSRATHAVAFSAIQRSSPTCLALGPAGKLLRGSWGRQELAAPVGFTGAHSGYSGSMAPFPPPLPTLALTETAPHRPFRTL